MSAEEYRTTARVLRGSQGATESWRFVSIELREPPKADMKAWKPGDHLPRLAQAVLWNREDNQAYDAVVDPADESVSWTHLSDVCPSFTVDEWHECDETMRAHPDVVAALPERGVTRTGTVVRALPSLGV